jgi:hypothetical protein
MPRIINIDLDNVVADFEGGFLLATGQPFDSFDTPEARWAAMRGRQTGFFYGLAAYPGAVEFVAKVEKLAKQHDCLARFLTAVPMLLEFPTGGEEKKLWVPDILGSRSEVVIAPFSKDKVNHCKPGDVLIDDSVLNIAQWREAGGIGILHTGSFDGSTTALIRALESSADSRPNGSPVNSTNRGRLQGVFLK